MIQRNRMAPKRRTGAGNGSLRVIVFMGIGTFLFLLLMAFGLNQSLKPQETERVFPGKARSPFDEDRAFADLAHLVGIGPRPSGSEGMAAQQAYILGELRKAGLQAHRDDFTADTPRGPLAMTNIRGVVQGTRPEVIVLSNHYDTKYFPDFTFVGANDGGSTTAWMLEMARILGPRREGRTIWLVFFDGEEAQNEAWSSEDSLYGSRHMVGALKASGALDKTRVLINVDMIGDCYLTISRDEGAPVWLSDIVWNTARRYDYGRHFGRIPTTLEDDHLPFREAGVPALELIDFSYGGTRVAHQQNWHTAEDTLDKVCRGSLRAVGDVIYHALPVIDGKLDTIGSVTDGQ